jgi:hypothetical protein
MLLPTSSVSSTREAIGFTAGRLLDAYRAASAETRARVDAGGLHLVLSWAPATEGSVDAGAPPRQVRFRYEFGRRDRYAWLDGPTAADGLVGVLVPEAPGATYLAIPPVPVWLGVAIVAGEGLPRDPWTGFLGDARASIALSGPVAAATGNGDVVVLLRANGLRGVLWREAASLGEPLVLLPAGEPLGHGLELRPEIRCGLSMSCFRRAPWPLLGVELRRRKEVDPADEPACRAALPSAEADGPRDA